MSENDPSPEPHVGALMSATSRLNDAFVAARYKLVGDLGLTSARFQVLETVAEEARAITAARIARKLGLSRQAVQRIVNDLVSLGFLHFVPDPQDRRALTISLTEVGTTVFREARARVANWSYDVANNIGLQIANYPNVLLEAAAVVSGDLSMSSRDNAPPMVASQAMLMPRDRGAQFETHGKKARAFEGVYDHILEQIKNGSLQPGSKLLAERELSTALRVGRPAVREALRALEMSGLLRFERGTGGGAFVREASADGIAMSIRNMLILGRLPPFDLNEVRTCIISQAARLAAFRGQHQDFQALERNIDLIEKQGKTGDPMATIEPVIAFYRLVGQSAHNPLMVILVDAIAEVMREMLIDLQIRTTIDVIMPRREMLAAMRRGDGEAAERAIRLHFEETGSLLRDYNPSAEGGWVRTRSCDVMSWTTSAPA